MCHTCGPCSSVVNQPYFRCGSIYLYHVSSGWAVSPNVGSSAALMYATSMARTPDTVPPGLWKVLTAPRSGAYATAAGIQSVCSTSSTSTRICSPSYPVMPPVRQPIRQQSMQRPVQRPMTRQQQAIMQQQQPMMRQQQPMMRQQQPIMQQPMQTTHRFRKPSDSFFRPTTDQLIHSHASVDVCVARVATGATLACNECIIRSIAER